ncbi:1-deoxy-D-xylulose-5-phosphate synthase [Thermaurantimonas aggregans]|uniref:1-deoxy-D-xylulose-5-phosphate synthase n=1 Tax=Thermaurantimonas aggregans TaxID=2173829 RepID=A0A401XNM3_9FLAO|nr:1-deoxy-D-xylulose-5-phosphate synthase N-terminal domain-containing protein [Thermaurantimonas aggregans]MCX8149812.1 thiamine pyrophosphate-dependent enzyme [Thermaurantimonas aggregans]GCD78563.1 1-deoxy-D-xylulose-5-phosphate synthase [Thermaurantimonas aggregans]
MKPFVFQGKEIKSPNDIRHLPTGELPELCKELRAYVAQIPTDKKAHLESSLGVTELTVALHYLLDTPSDRLIWDVGHQMAVHKVLTGRGAAMYQSLRRHDGISGFPSPAESPYDLFFTGHSSTSISMALGLWFADKNPKTVAVIGDGALTGGQSFEALNIAGEWNADILVILNDNGLSIDPNVGALSTFGKYQDYFEALNFSYLGEVDGNNILELLPKLKKAIQVSGPRVLRVFTHIQRIENSVSTANPLQPIRTSLRKAVEYCLQKHSDLYVLSPAMLAGAGLKEVREKYPERVLDTGITEQACVGIASGLAKGGKKVIVHIYSTFLQRAVDQLIHDVALQGFPVMFVVDRAGLVGEDGPTHHGVFDFQILSTIPGVKVYFPDSTHCLEKDIQNWANAPHLAALRIPRDSAVINFDNDIPDLLWKDAPNTLLAVGTLSHQAFKAFKRLVEKGLPLNFVSVHSLDAFENTTLLDKLGEQKRLFIAEENYFSGSLAEKLSAYIALKAHGERLPKIVLITLPHSFITHGTPEELLHLTGLSSEGIFNTIIQNLEN